MASALPESRTTISLKNISKVVVAIGNIYFIKNFKSRRFLGQFHFFKLLFNEKKDEKDSIIDG